MNRLRSYTSSIRNMLQRLIGSTSRCQFARDNGGLDSTKVQWYRPMAVYEPWPTQKFGWVTIVQLAAPMVGPYRYLTHPKLRVTPIPLCKWCKLPPFPVHPLFFSPHFSPSSSRLESMGSDISFPAGSTAETLYCHLPKINLGAF